MWLTLEDKESAHHHAVLVELDLPLRVATFRQTCTHNTRTSKRAMTEHILRRSSRGSSRGSSRWFTTLALTIQHSLCVVIFGCDGVDRWVQPLITWCVCAPWVHQRINIWVAVYICICVFVSIISRVWFHYVPYHRFLVTHTLCGVRGITQYTPSN